jgi:ribosomal protein S18 acetylase RimI-like enzyme
MNISRLRATDDDIAHAIKLVKQFHAKDVAYLRIQYFLANPAHYVIIAEINAEIAGFLLAYALERIDREAAQMFIYEVEVAPNYRRQGIGTALVRHIVDLARAEKMLEAFVSTNRSNTAAMRLYAATGRRIEHGDDLLFVYPFA